MRILTALLASTLFLAACSSGDPKSLTDEGWVALNSGDSGAALERFDAALGKLGTNSGDASYLRARFGRCKALTRIDAKRARADFLGLAGEKPQEVREDDFGEFLDALLKSRQPDAVEEAVAVLEAAKKSFAGSKKLDAYVKAVGDASKGSKDPKLKSRLEGLGYTSSG